ncbi:hypothetical protein EVAR_42006_1 [Eumeta japonica]|uniref:Uncharacterized protein n=1 Tax=Eumeta variegata TaxID=151549 RepID=A0A4C1WM52_EUMVA|nr:hypothetical protein EVAR_42006_1 [Eumeta japonica]
MPSTLLETAKDGRVTSLQSERINRLNRIHDRLVCEATEEREHRPSVIRNRLTDETSERRQHRLDVINKRIGTELPSTYAKTAAVERKRKRQRQNRLNPTRRNWVLRKDEIIFAINVFEDVLYSICRKIFYPKQRCDLQTSYPPSELVEMNKIVTCSRCSANIKKRKVPSQA